MRSDAERFDPEFAAVDAALVAWREKAADVLLSAVAAVHLLPVVLAMLGNGPPMGPLVKAAALTGYCVIVIAALLRRVQYRKRLLASLCAAYLAISVMSVALPRGPYAQVGLVTVPVFALVLIGAPIARRAVIACAAVLVLAPLMRILPGVAQALDIEPLTAASPPGLVWMQTAALAAFLFALMILLDRFHGFLLKALTAQCKATRDLQREVAEHLDTQQKMQDEMWERQRLQREIAAIGDTERRHLGQELHDGVCQQVTAALLRCQALERRLERGGTVSGVDLETLSSVLADSIDEAHDVARGLCPLEPHPDALAPALRALTRRTQEMADIRCDFFAAGDIRVPDADTAQHLYRIAQEALSNAVRHARATRIEVRLRGSDCELMLEVHDNGAGLPSEPPAGGMGLRTMACRAQILDGQLAVAPAVGGGTRVTCRVPRLAGAPAVPEHSGEERWMAGR